MSGPELGPLAWVCLLAAGGAALICVHYLVRRPTLNLSVKLGLLAGLGVLPGLAALSGNVIGFEVTTERRFCGSCHVMTPYQEDSENPESTSLAALHARNSEFGGHNCYACHADYGMYGTVVTKASGMRHVYEYFLNGYNKMTLEEARAAIHILKPFPNATCLHCHSARLPGWQDEPDHAAVASDLEKGTVSCASEGCHGPAHPFSKVKP
jgi:cytochrome c-type protein NapC